MNTDDPTTTSTGQPTADHASIAHYEIRVSGHLGSRWSAWFDGMSLTNLGDGTTVIAGPVVDQAALHGVLQKLRDLGVGLLSLNQLGPDETLERQPGHSRPNEQEQPS